MSSPSQRLTIWRHSQKSYKMPHMKNIYTPKKKMFKTTATFCEVEVAVGCWVLSLSTNYRDLSAIVSSAAPKKGCLFRHTSKTQGIGVGDRSRKMVLSRSFDAWSRFAHHCHSTGTLHSIPSFLMRKWTSHFLKCSSKCFSFWGAGLLLVNSYITVPFVKKMRSYLCKK